MRYKYVRRKRKRATLRSDVNVDYETARCFSFRGVVLGCLSKQSLAPDVMQPAVHRQWHFRVLQNIFERSYNATKRYQSPPLNDPFRYPRIRSILRGSSLGLFGPETVSFRTDNTGGSRIELNYTFNDITVTSVAKSTRLRKNGTLGLNWILRWTLPRWRLLQNEYF